MFITKKHLSRRTFLTGMGATVALPFLESMVPAQTPRGDCGCSPPAAGLHRNGPRQRRQHAGRHRQTLLGAGKGRAGFRVHDDSEAARALP